MCNPVATLKIAEIESMILGNRSITSYMRGVRTTTGVVPHVNLMDLRILGARNNEEQKFVDRVVESLNNDGRRLSRINKGKEAEKQVEKEDM